MSSYIRLIQYTLNLSTPSINGVNCSHLKRRVPQYDSKQFDARFDFFIKYLNLYFISLIFIFKL